MMTYCTNTVRGSRYQSQLPRHCRFSCALFLPVFICSFMVAAPIFGYLGDRFNRKVILSCGIFFWSVVTLSSSFIGKEVRRHTRALSPRLLAATQPKLTILLWICLKLERAE